MKGKIVYTEQDEIGNGGESMKKSQKNVTAKILESVARNAAKMSGESRCMYIFHQPKQPENMKRLSK